MNYSSLSRLCINSWKKISSFIQMNETWENWQLNKKINVHLTRLNQLEELWSYSQSDISRPSPFWKSIYLSLEMSERNISLRVYLQMMYFLCVKFQENLLNRLIGMGWSIGGCQWVPDPLHPALEFQNICKKIYKNCLDYLLNLAIVRIPLEKKLDPPIIEISLARSNLYEIAVKS